MLCARKRDRLSLVSSPVVARRVLAYILDGHNPLPENGGFMSYGPNRLEPDRRAVVSVDKILKDAKPSGLAIPPSMLVRVERVIDQ